MLALHRARQGFVKARTAQANQIRGLLTEHGIIVPKGIAHINPRLPQLLEDAENDLPGTFRQLIERLGEHLKVLTKQVNELEEQIWYWHKENSADWRHYRPLLHESSLPIQTLQCSQNFNLSQAKIIYIAINGTSLQLIILNPLEYKGWWRVA